MNQIIEILEHWQAGRSVKSIAESLGVDRKTVRKYVNGVLSAGVTRESYLEREEWVALLKQRFPELDHAQRSPTYFLLEPHKNEIRDALGKNRVITVWKRQVVPTLPGLSLSSFRRWLRDVMPEVITGNQVTVWRPDVPPGEESQIDFGYLGPWQDPATNKQLRVWAFIMVLSYSRHMFVEPVFRLDSPTWLHCHIEAFEFFGRAPRRLVLDNLKDGVVKPDIYDPEINLEYARLARHYGTLVDPCRAGHPKDKPRVERQVSYVRESMWTGMRFGNVAHMRQHSRRWCVEDAGARIHGTTRWRPFEYYEQNEKQHMLPLPAERFEVFELTTAKVAPDSHCQVRKARYSVPFRFLGRTLSVRVGEKTVEFYHGEDLVKTHIRRFDQGTSTDMRDLPEEKTAFYLHTPQVCLQKARQIGTPVHDVVLALLNQGALIHLRQAQGILRLEQKHGAGRLNTACKMALSCDDPHYRTIKRILDNRMDMSFTEEPTDRSARIGAYLHGSNAFAFDLPQKGV
ncbi:MAG: IS21 family transposase [Armatimonadota bacterium]|nr:IS21 family transposase [Armatimonadota bacterium]